MKSTKSAMCALLIFALLCTFAACSKTPSPAAPKVEAADTPADFLSPSPEPTIEPEPTPNPDEGLTPDSFVLINDVDQVLDRPHEIQPGTVAVFHSYDVPAYTPWNATAELWLTKNIYEGLVYCYMDRPDDIRPLIAESWHVSDDYLTWTFKIREGIKFTDGTLCDAEAISASWNYYTSISPATFKNLNISFWEATDEYELTVHMSSPCSYVESAFSEPYIVSPTAVAQYGVNDNRSAVGTAPYYVKEYVTNNMGNFPPDLELICSANTEYYLYERMPVIETVVFKIAYGLNVNFDLFVNGELDGYFANSFDNPVDNYNELMSRGFDGTVLQGHGSASAIFLDANEIPEFQIYEVRKAMNRLIDLDALNNELYGGLGLVQSSLWSVDSFGEVEWSEGFYYDPDEAFELFAAAGIDASSLQWNARIADYEIDTFEILKKQLAAAGITLEFTRIMTESSYSEDHMRYAPFNEGSQGYSNAKPYLPWTFILLPEHLIKMVWADLYDPALYDNMRSEYEAMISACTWDEMVAHCKTLTDLVQKDYAAMPGVQAPYFAAFNKELKGIVLIGENHTLLWNYLYY